MGSMYGTARVRHGMQAGKYAVLVYVPFVRGTLLGMLLMFLLL